MNIVLISSCQDSSNLAKELNKKMKNSVVFRIDLLKNLKNIIPFTSISNNSCGDYLGDIEKIEFSKISDVERQIAKVFQATVKVVEETPALSNAMSSRKVSIPSIDRVTRNFDSLSLTLVRVVSGIQSVNQLKSYLNGNKENEKQEFHDLAGRLIYNISRVTDVNLEASYHFQKGRGLNLNLSILRAELKTQYRLIYLTVGIEGYGRIYSSEKRNYWGSFIRIERKF